MAHSVNTIGDVIKIKGSTITTIAPEKSLEVAARIMAKVKVGAILVCKEKFSIVGLLSERDIIRAMAQHGESAASMKISELIARKLKTCSTKDLVHDVIRTMHKGRFRHMPVIEDSTLKGFVSIGDLLTYELGME